MIVQLLRRGKPRGEHGVNRLGRVGEARPGFEVQPVRQVARCVVRGAVIGEHVALKPPVALQDVVEEVRVLAGVVAVQPVVGAHDRSHMRVLHRGLELRQVDLAQRALVHNRVLGHAVARHGRRTERLTGIAEVGHRSGVALLVVGGEVLHVRHYALGLRAVDPAHGGPRVEERVLAICLEGAATERSAHDVHGGGEDHVVAFVLRLVADHVAVADGHRRIEGGRQSHRRRHRRGRSLPHAHRAVRVVDGRKTDSRDAIARARVAVCPAGSARQIVAREQRDLLVLGEGVEQKAGAGVGGQRRVAPRVVAAAPGGMRRRGEQHPDQPREQRGATPPACLHGREQCPNAREDAPLSGRRS